MFTGKTRQTLLFSATLLGAMAAMENSKRSRGGGKSSSETTKLKPMNANEVTCSRQAIKQYLPGFLVQLMDAVAVQKDVRIFDASTKYISTATTSTAVSKDKSVIASADGKGKKSTTTTAAGTGDGSSAGEAEEAAAVAQMNNVSVADSLLLLPSTLQQYEIRAPMEEKDVMAYYFLSSVSMYNIN